MPGERSVKFAKVRVTFKILTMQVAMLKLKDKNWKFKYQYFIKNYFVRMHFADFSGSYVQHTKK
jgi:hypothetical protein